MAAGRFHPRTGPNENMTGCHKYRVRRAKKSAGRLHPRPGRDRNRASLVNYQSGRIKNSLGRVNDRPGRAWMRPDCPRAYFSPRQTTRQNPSSTPR